MHRILILWAALPLLSEELTDKMVRLDREMFEAYNKCELERFGALFEDGVEFYHDQGGAMVGRKALVEAVRANICGQTRRELVAGSLKVYPMKGFGAVVMGTHRFFPAGSRQASGVAQFVHLWRESGGQWKVTRVISYDHQPLP